MCVSLGHSWDTFTRPHLPRVSPIMGETSLATIERRSSKDGQLVYRVKVRRRGAPPQNATFTKLSDARKWAQVIEGAAIEGRHFPTAEAKSRTLSDLLERYLRDVLPYKRTSPEDSREHTLRWWQTQLGHCLLADVIPARIAACRDLLARGSGQSLS